MGSFENLNKLYSLDLSFNNLTSIESFIFNGLINLNDLNILSYLRIEINNESFANLFNMGNIFLNEIEVKEYKCLLMFSFKREIKRNVLKGKYTFYKSLNFINRAEMNCSLIFSLFQF